MLRDRPLCYKLDRILYPTTLLPYKCQRIAIANEVPQVSVLGPILFVIYVNDLIDNLTIDHLLYADDIKLIVPWKQADALQSSLGTSSKQSDNLELILSPSKCGHLPVGDTSYPATYSLTSRISPNA